MNHSEEKLAIIGGSRGYSLLASGALAGERIPPMDTPFGLSQPITVLKVNGREALFLSRHGERGYSIAAPWVNYRANIWALKECGTSKIISWSGPAAIDDSLKIGQFVLPDDLIDETKTRESSFFKGTGWGFVRQNPVFCPEIRNRLELVVEGLGLKYRSTGTYVCTEGPRLETPAEIRKFKTFGGDLVGMTLSPEVFLAKELEMCYASICYVTNYAEGIRERTFAPGVLFEGLLDEQEKHLVDEAVDQFPKIIEAIAGLDAADQSCSCSRLMERYRKRGDIGPDWHAWVRGEGAHAKD